MAKRKKTKKRTVSPGIRPAAATTASNQHETLAPSVAPLSSAPVAAGQWAYVGRDITKIGVLVSACVLIEIGMLYLVNNSSLGRSLYELIKL